MDIPRQAQPPGDSPAVRHLRRGVPAHSRGAGRAAGHLPVEPERAPRGHRAPAPRARPGPSALATVLVVAGRIHAGRLGLQLQRWPSRCQPHPGAGSRQPRAGRHVDSRGPRADAAGRHRRRRAARPLVRSDHDERGGGGHFAAGVLVRPPAPDRVRVRPRLAAFVGPHVAWNGTVRRRHDGRRHRSRAPPAAAGHRAGGRAGSGVVTVSSRVDD